MRLIFSLLFICFSLSALAHEGHHKDISEQELVQKNGEQVDESVGGKPQTWTQWIGSFHLVLVHFPIALINMVIISELLLARSGKPMFEFSSRFMLIAAAIISTPTAILGFVFSYSSVYEAMMAPFLWWHMWLGICTALLTIVVAAMRERYGVDNLYYVFLVILVLLVNLTGFFGGGMVFGPYHMYPPL